MILAFPFSLDGTNTVSGSSHECAESLQTTCTQEPRMSDCLERAGERSWGPIHSAECIQVCTLSFITYSPVSVLSFIVITAFIKVTLFIYHRC